MIALPLYGVTKNSMSGWTPLLMAATLSANQARRRERLSLAKTTPPCSEEVRMIIDENALYNPQTAPGDNHSQVGVIEPRAESPLLRTSRTARSQRRQSEAERKKRLHALLLARQVGYLEVEPFDHRHIFDSLPRRSFVPNEVIPCDGLLCVIERGSIQLRRARDEYPVKELRGGAVFGEMPSMGQTMSVTEAIAGTRGVTLAIMSAEQAAQWAASDPLWLLKIIGRRLTERETDLYRVEFQPAESRLAALMLKLAGGGGEIKLHTQKAMGEMIGLHREVVTLAFQRMRDHGVIDTRRRKITILNKDALREMSEL